MRGRLKQIVVGAAVAGFFLWTFGCGGEDKGDKGSECSFDEECADGLLCDARQCQPPPKEGDPCVPDRVCDPSLRCNYGYDPPKCAALSKEGEPCYYGNDCADFESGFICNHGYNPPRCLKPGALGDRCEWFADCADGLVCSLVLLDGGVDLQCLPQPGM